MFKVYILKSLSNPSKSYVGLTTKQITERLQEHNDGLSTFTKTDKPWKMIYYESFYCKLCADKREKFFKSGFGNNLKKIIFENFD